MIEEDSHDLPTPPEGGEPEKQHLPPTPQEGDDAPFDDLSDEDESLPTPEELGLDESDMDLYRLLVDDDDTTPNPQELHFNPLPKTENAAPAKDEEEDVCLPPMYKNRLEFINDAFNKCIPELHTPVTTPLAAYCKEHNFEFLLKLDYYLVLALIRRYMGDAIYRAFCSRRVFHVTYHAVTDLLNDMLSENHCRVTDTVRAMAQQAKADEKQFLAERLTRINPCAKGTFRLCGRRGLERFFNENIIDVVNNFAVYRRLGVKFPHAFILEGVPGCGKTYAVERLAEHLDWPTYRITTASVGTSLIHETSKNIQNTFETAAANAPSFVIIDEVDALVPDRSANPKDFVCEEVASFLRCLQEAQENHVLVVGMTNRLSAIDPAVLRTGRLGTHITVGMPDRDEVRELLEFHLSDRPLGELDLERYVDRLTCGALSDVTYVVEEAAMNAGRRRAEQIESCDIEAAFTRLHEQSKTTAAPQRGIGFHAA